VTFLGVLTLVAAILAAWFVGALLLALLLGRFLAAGAPRTPRQLRRDFDRAA
jgi:hypothetical protein